MPSGVIADSFFAKGQSPKNLLATVAALIQKSQTQISAHQKEDTPAWIPRNGNDSHGIPYVVVMCAECLRTFPLPISEETTGKVLEATCAFCPGKNRYIIEPAPERIREVYV